MWYRIHASHQIAYWLHTLKLNFPSIWLQFWQTNKPNCILCIANFKHSIACARLDSSNISYNIFQYYSLWTLHLAFHSIDVPNFPVSVYCWVYGNTGCRVFERGVQNWKVFCIKINIPKGNYWILRIGVMGRCQKVPWFDF